MIRYALVFCALFFMDIAWTKYTLAVTKAHAYRAASWSALIVVLSGYAALSYVGDKWTLLAAAAGGWLGTFVTIKREDKGNG